MDKPADVAIFVTGNTRLYAPNFVDLVEAHGLKTKRYSCTKDFTARKVLVEKALASPVIAFLVDREYQKDSDTQSTYRAILDELDGKHRRKDLALFTTESDLKTGHDEVDNAVIMDEFLYSPSEGEKANHQVVLEKIGSILGVTDDLIAINTAWNEAYLVNQKNGLSDFVEVSTATELKKTGTGEMYLFQPSSTSVEKVSNLYALDRNALIKEQIAQFARDTRSKWGDELGGGVAADPLIPFWYEVFEKVTKHFSELYASHREQHNERGWPRAVEKNLAEYFKNTVRDTVPDIGQDIYNKELENVEAASDYEEFCKTGLYRFIELCRKEKLGILFGMFPFPNSFPLEKQDSETDEEFQEKQAYARRSEIIAREAASVSDLRQDDKPPSYFDLKWIRENRVDLWRETLSIPWQTWHRVKSSVFKFEKPAKPLPWISDANFFRFIWLRFSREIWPVMNTIMGWLAIISLLIGIWSLS